MTATQSTRPANEFTDWALLQYHNKCVARAANWAEGCKSVIHLQVDKNTSSFLAIVLKVAVFAIVSIGLLIYDVMQEARNGCLFPKSEVAAPPVKAKPPEEPKKTKAAPPPSPQKRVTENPVVHNEAFAESLELAKTQAQTLEAHGEVLGVLTDSTQTIKKKINQFATNLATLQSTVDGVVKQIGALALAPPKSPKKVRFLESSYARTPGDLAKKTPRKSPYPHKEDIPPIEDDSDASLASIEEWSSFRVRTPCTPQLNDSDVVRLQELVQLGAETLGNDEPCTPKNGKLNLSGIVALATIGLQKEASQRVANNQTNNSTASSTASVTPRRRNIFEGLLTPSVDSTSKRRSPDLANLSMELTPAGNKKEA